jgi:alpha-N-arabinofuranosidase
MATARLILPGFHPDPSICRRGNEYVIASSTFGYFPGVPIHRSTDLIHWEQVGHALDRPSQLPLAGALATSGGIYAPTLRHHAGRFWLITTNVSHGGHFICHAQDPAGPWSDPVWIDAAHQGGIDPDLFWDDQGTCWVSCTRRDREPAEPHHGIWQFPIDPLTGQGLGDRRFTWGGSGGKSPEGPHLFRRGSWHYLLVAEGGTEYGHMVTIARGPSPTGPWEPCPRNPILTHRSVGARFQSLGHADLVEAPDGAWSIVFLGVRQIGYPWTHHLGRETFIAPLRWSDDGWPEIMEGRPLGLEPPATPPPIAPAFAPGVDLWRSWTCLRDPAGILANLEARPGWLRLHGRRHGLDAGRPSPELMARPPWECPQTSADLAEPIAFLGVRQRDFALVASVTLDFVPADPGAEAGLAVFMSERCHYALAIRSQGGRRVAVLVRCVLDLEAASTSGPLADGPLQLEVRATPYLYAFAVIDAAGRRHDLGTGLAKLLSTEVAGGFAGVFIGIYAVDPANGAGAPADFSAFICRHGEPAA